MDKRLFISLVVLTFIIPIAYSLTNIMVDETELVAIRPSFQDPDGDVIEYTYSYPLNDDGEWQTDYGDTGNYVVTVTASDGELVTEEEVIIQVKKKEEAPEIIDLSPDDILLSAVEGDSLHFSAEASDLNGDELSYEWFVDSESIGYGQELDYYVDYFSQGTRTVNVVVSDGTLQTSQEWSVDVEDVDRISLLDNITDYEANELDTISLELPDFGAYDLDYEISQPIGNENLWETTYNDEGEYRVTIRIKDREFEYSKAITITVHNIDRGPKFNEISDRIISEGEEVVISADVYDPDNDEVTITLLDAPKGSTFDGKTLRWTPNRDFVKKTNFYTNLLDKFHLLKGAHDITFVAESNGIKASKTVRIVVLDDNRAPIIKNLEPIIVNEGETISLEAKGYDLDNDRVRYKYSGWMNEPTRETDYNDAGTYTVLVRASDGKSTVEGDLTIIVNDVNRPPTISELPKHEVSEGELVHFSIETYDPDSDEITIIGKNTPAGSVLDEDGFKWTPGYDETRMGEAKEYTITFIASDGIANDSKDAAIVVHNTNRAPQVLDVSPTIGQFGVYTGSSVIFQVVAEDPDDDALSYEWDFGLLQKYKGGASHGRKFLYPGRKEVTAIVSDGDSSVSVKWIVDVVKQQVAEEMVVTSAETQQQVVSQVQPEPVPIQPVVQQPVPQAPAAQPIQITPTSQLTYKTYIVTEKV